ncbi:MAG TPA: NADP-dependent isocitrate dehydrogenase [Candidatus Marinimicrobia bacterium]|nr:NADP-dependent isocitrate dehydrogenase [Candidatus Neomarinimicrobiota bacterium]
MFEQCIIKHDGKIQTPDFPVIPYIEGDGIGAEITRPTLEVIDHAVRKAYSGKRKIQWIEIFAGDKAYRQTGEWLPADTVTVIEKYLVALKGPLATPVGGGIRSLNVALRRQLDLYACVRPVRWFQGIESPLKKPELVDMVIFRENTEDLYCGIEFMRGEAETAKVEHFLMKELYVKAIPFPGDSSYGIKPVSKNASERLVRASVRYAIEQRRPAVTLVHKGNIMKFTEGAFRNWGFGLIEKEFQKDCYLEKDAGQSPESGKICIRDRIVDAFFQDMLLNPARHSIVATLNLNGDYISDLAAAMVGGVGIAPGANIHFETGRAVFEATHGTAPDIAGQDKANPTSLILSGKMLLEHIGWQEAATLIQRAVEKMFQEKTGTSDLFAQTTGARMVGTAEFAERLRAAIEHFD